MKLIDKFKTAAFIIKKTVSICKELIVIQFILSFVSLAIALFIVYFPSLILSYLLTMSDITSGIRHLAGLLAILLLLRFIATLLTKRSTALQEIVNQKILRQMDNAVLSVRYQWIETPSFIDQLNKAAFPITTYNVIKAFFTSLPKLIQNVMLIGSALAIILTYRPLIVLIVLLISVISFVLTKRLMKIEWEEANIMLKKNKEYNYYLRIVKNPDIAKDVRIYQMQPHIMHKIRTLFDGYIQSGYRTYGSRDLRTAVSVGASILLLITVYTYLLLNSSDSLSAASLILLVNSALALSQSIHSISDELLILNQNIVYLYEFYKFEKMINDIPFSGTIILNSEIETIEFKDVHFTYPGSKQEILSGVNFRLDNKQTLSLVGRNGSGKTTIIKLLTRLYEPTQGKILINGIPLCDLELNSYLDQLSVVFQDFSVFNYTIKENIQFDQNYSEEQIKKSAEEAELASEFVKFPDGLDTYITKEFSDRGISLSQGQMQRLAIARAIVRSASLLVLDEPTAALDPIAEEEIFQRFIHLTKNKLSIIISHRLSSCKYADNILVLDHGKISEAGSHQQLMLQNGEYARMYRLQSSKYK